MYVERLLQINIATLACLASLLLGMGQRSTAMPLGMLVAAMVSVWVADFKGWFRLNKTVADWAAVGALAICLPGALRLDKIAIVSAVAEFLVLLQVIHLFRRKDAAVYWQLVRFSVLQIVVAALLTQEFLFGPLLVLYLFTALGAMTLLFLHSEWTQQHRRMAPAPAPSVARARWPLAHQEPAFWGASSGRAPLGREIVVRLVRMGFATLVIAVVVFFAVPRFGRGAWRGFGGMVRPTVGFSGRVRLGELGKIIRNPEEVMRVRFEEPQTANVYPTHGEIYLRGAVLTEYRRSEWRPPAEDAGFRGIGGLAADREYQETPVRQVIFIEPLDREELFCVWPFTFLYPDWRIEYSKHSQRLTRLPEFCSDRFRYELGTSAFWQNEQAALTPSEGLVDPSVLLQMPKEAGGNPLAGLAATAQQWVAAAGPKADRYQRALAIERQLRHSGQYRYSLERQNRDPALDPVEDFITKNRRGHCEYFATALCLMLRSQGIPARVVIGYRSGEFNRTSGFYHVRQLHAHTWVEAYLAPGQIPVELVKDRPSWGWLTGAWLRLDATPAADDESTAKSLLARLGGLFGQLNFAWNNYIMEMDRPRQREAIYNPVVDAIRRAIRSLADPAWWRQAIRNVMEGLGLGRWRVGALRLSWPGLALTLLAGVLVILACYALWYSYRRWIAPWRGLRGPTQRRLRARVAFYRRLETILARRGFVRRPSQTPREFALATGRQIAGWAGQERLALLPVQVADAYYLVRFGDKALDESQAAAVEQALAGVEKALATYPFSGRRHVGQLRREP